MGAVLQMRRIFLRYRYGFELTLAYLAGNMGDTQYMDDHVSAADKVWLELWKEQKK